MRRLFTSLAALVTLTTVGLATAPATVAGASGGSTPVVVTSADLIAYPGTPSQGQFVVVNNGDGTGTVSDVSNGPTAQQGSLQMTTTGTGSHWSVFNEDWGGTALSAITSLSYQTETNDTGNTLDPGLQLVIDPGNTTSGPDQGVTYSTLSYEPYLQVGGQTANVWQSWNVMDGVVWGTHLTGAPNSAPISWSTFLTDYPNATILPEADGGGMGVNVGSGWSAMVGNVGSITFGTSEGSTTYTFDPSAPSTSTTTTPTSSSIVLGQSNTDSATVAGNDVVGSPTGTVQFYECGPTASPADCTSVAHPVGSPVSVTAAGDGMSSTASSVSFTPTATGYWCFAGDYSGDSNYAASSDTSTDECFDVTAASSTTVSTPTASSVVYGDNVGDSAVVTGNAAGGSPTGEVQFYVCGPTSNATPCTSTSNPVSLDEPLAGASHTATANSIEFTPTSAGYWCFAADYSGSADYHASSDATTDECVDVTMAATTTTTKLTNSTLTLGQAETDTATVGSGNPTFGSPPGTVSFYECGLQGTPTRCTSKADLIDAPVTVTAESGYTARATSDSFTPTAAGYWCFAAYYSGTTNFAASSDTTVTNECVDVMGPLVMVTTSLPHATEGKAYSAAFKARGGKTPYTWGHKGSLPYGIKLNASTGVLSGTPKVSGTFHITIGVKDSSKPKETASRSFTLVIAS